MFCRAQRLAIAVLLTAIPSGASAQIFWQPASPSSVTAENTGWFIAGEPVVWNGALYYPVGVPRALNRYQMVRSGSYRGIPLYTDLNLEPNSTVFLPLSGERVQAYERPGSGMLAGTQGRPSLPPTDINALGYAGIAQAAAAPARAQPYDPAMVELPVGVVTSPVATMATAPEAPRMTVAAGGQMAGTSAHMMGTRAPMVGTSGQAVGTSAQTAGTSGRTVPASVETGAPGQMVGTTGRSAAVAPERTVTTVIPPTGANTIWVEYDGRRWYAAGKSIAYDAVSLNEVGTYRGWTVYAPKNDSSVIYIPSAAGRLSVYKRR